MRACETVDAGISVDAGYAVGTRPSGAAVTGPNVDVRDSQCSARRLPGPLAVTSDRRQRQLCRRPPRRHLHVVRNASNLREAMKGHGNDAQPCETEEDRRRRVTAERKARAHTRREWVPRHSPA